jgi:hypothetical protein
MKSWTFTNETFGHDKPVDKEKPVVQRKGNAGFESKWLMSKNTVSKTEERQHSNSEEKEITKTPVTSPTVPKTPATPQEEYIITQNDFEKILNTKPETNPTRPPRTNISIRDLLN